MMRSQGRSLTPLSSRSSLVGVGSMPVIAENEVARSPPASPTATLFGSINGGGSPPPLRIPKKNPRRAGSLSPSPSPSPSPPAGANRNSVRGLPPPYVPPYILEPPTLRPPPPRYTKEDAEMAEQEERGMQQQQQQQDEVEAGQVGGGGPTRRARMADRWCCVLGVVVALLVIVAVGLAIGLTVGLKDKHHDGDNDSSSSSSSSSDQSFPAGSFAFQVDLQGTLTNCTSNPSTWRCYPYTAGDSATFYWIITAQDSSSSSNYTISSTENPFAPSFSDRALSLLDAGQPTERLRFSFSSTKTVVPADNLTTSNRAATCSFADTIFSATLWTKRRGGKTVAADEPTPGDVKFGDWPRDVEVEQIKESELGQPRCEDGDGNIIADVQAEAGRCACEYANF